MRSTVVRPVCADDAVGIRIGSGYPVAMQTLMKDETE